MNDIFITTTIYTLQKIQALDNADNALVLYMFYCRHAKNQKTNQPWANVEFCMKGLNWGKDKVRDARRSLLSIKLITDIPSKKFKGKPFVRINYMSSKNTINSIVYDESENKTHEPTENQQGSESENKTHEPTENTTSRETSVKCLKSNKLKTTCLKSAKAKSFSYEKARSDEREDNKASNTLQSSSDSLANKKTENDLENSFVEFDYSPETKQVLQSWFDHGGQVFKIPSAKGVQVLDGMIFELLNNSLNPYHKVVEQPEDKAKVWTVQELISCIVHFTTVLKKDISKMHLSRFILSQAYSSNKRRATQPDFSPLFEVSQVLTELPTKQSLKLKKVFLNGTPVPETVFIRAANSVEVLAEKYKVTDSACESLRRNIHNVFIRYVKEKQNDARFDIKYMCGEGFMKDFVKDMTTRNVLIKKSKAGSMGVGRRVG